MRRVRYKVLRAGNCDKCHQYCATGAVRFILIRDNDLPDIWVICWQCLQARYFYYEGEIYEAMADVLEKHDKL